MMILSPGFLLSLWPPILSHLGWLLLLHGCYMLGITSGIGSETAHPVPEL